MLFKRRSSPHASLLLSPQQGGGNPLFVHVVMTSSDEVVSLRNQVETLESQLDTYRQISRRAEYKYSCAVTQNMQILDWLRENRIKYPSRFNNVHF